MEGVVSSSQESENENTDSNVSTRNVVKHGEGTSTKAIVKKPKDKKNKAQEKSAERKLAALKAKAIADRAAAADNEKRSTASSDLEADDLPEQKPLKLEPDGPHRLIPLDAHNAPENDPSNGRKRAIKGEEDTSLLHVLCYESRTGEKRELHFSKIVISEIDWNKTEHIAAINGWRTQIWSRAGYKMKNVSLYHPTEDEYLECFVSVCVAKGLKKAVRFASVNYIVTKFNEFFADKTLKNEDGTDTDPRPWREASSFASKVGRVQTTVKKADPKFKTAFDKEAREFQPTVTEDMLREFQAEKAKLLGGTRDKYDGKKKVPRIDLSISAKLVEFCDKFLVEENNDATRTKSTSVPTTTSAPSKSSRVRKTTSSRASPARVTRGTVQRSLLSQAVKSSSSGGSWATIDDDQSGSSYSRCSDDHNSNVVEQAGSTPDYDSEADVSESSENIGAGGISQRGQASEYESDDDASGDDDSEVRKSPLSEYSSSSSN